MPTAALPIVPVILWEPLTVKKDSQSSIVREITNIFVAAEPPAQRKTPAPIISIAYKPRSLSKAAAAVIARNVKPALPELPAPEPNALHIPRPPAVKMHAANAARHLSAIAPMAVKPIPKKPAVLTSV